MKSSLHIPAFVLAASLGLLATGCMSGGGSTATEPAPTVVTTTEATSEEAPTTTEETETEGEPPAGEVTYQVWFTNADGLFVTYRTEAATERVGTAALGSLLEGPDSFEQGYGLRTKIPAGTQLLGLEIDRGIAHVHLTSEFESGGSTASIRKRFAQVVYTLTQFPTVRGVLVSTNGEATCLVASCALRRRDYADLLPAILVTSPALNQSVQSPVLVRGSANVFEANIGIEILDQNGDVLVDTFTTATCGTGCRGTFRASVAYEIDRERDGTIVVHDDDAAGTGTYPHEVRIPVRLLP